MKILIIVASVILTIKAATDEELWLQFKQKHGREYINIIEEQTRFSIFQKNLRKIEKHNEKYERGETSYYLGINEFADISREEFRAMFNYSRANKPDTSAFQLNSLETVSEDSLPEELDWRTKNIVTEVKYQGACSSCWAFAAVGFLEGAYALKYGKLVALSEQNLLDCSSDPSPYKNHGCITGTIQQAYNYVQDNGVEAQSDYPYTAVQETCKYDSSKVVIRAVSHVTLDDSEIALKKAVATIGPMATAVDSSGYHLYSGGIYDDEECSHTVDHGVLVVGYGTENGVPYWLVKNSWGADWGEDGYIRHIRDKGDQCAIASDVCYAVIV